MQGLTDYWLKINIFGDTDLTACFGWLQPVDEMEEYRYIYLFRHCETEHFSRKRCIGQIDVALSENGIRHAHFLNNYLKDKKLNAIYCSDALRAVKTAEILAGGEVPVIRLAELREINMGDWDGMYFDDIKSKFPEDYRRRGLDFASFSPPNGESFANCQKRALKALHTVLEHSAGNIAVIAHAGFNRALLCKLCKFDLQQLFTIPQPYGCVNLLSVQNGVCRVLQIGFSETEL